MLFTPLATVMLSSFQNWLTASLIAPSAAGLMAIADVFDALISRRSYKEAFSFELTLQLMSEQRGRHFDPDLLDIFIGAYDEFCRLALEHSEVPATAAAATGSTTG